MIEVFGKPNCPYCDQAKQLLEAKGIEYEYIDVSKDDDALAFLMDCGLKTVPQCFDGNVHIGGFTQLQDYVVHKM